MDKSWNWSNVKINLYALPLVMGFFFWIANKFPSIVGYSYEDKSKYVFFIALVYAWCSRFFQPDLDHDDNRPGKGSFPIGVAPTNAWFKFLQTIMTPVLGKKYASNVAFALSHALLIGMSKVWNAMWIPYAFMTTHRGVSHWPIIGTIMRVGYVYLTAMLIMKGLALDTKVLEEIMKGFFFWENINIYTIYVAVPIYACDIMHSFGDLIESRIKGFDFCPPKVRRSPLAKLLRIPI